MSVGYVQNINSVHQPLVLYTSPWALFGKIGKGSVFNNFKAIAIEEEEKTT